MDVTKYPAGITFAWTDTNSNQMLPVEWVASNFIATLLFFYFLLWSLFLVMNDDTFVWNICLTLTTNLLSLLTSEPGI